MATEPGLPLLDQGGANYALLRMWLGRFVAEPQRQGPNMVAYFVQADEGGRVTQLTCAPVTREDLKGPLKEEWDALKAKLAKAKPATSSERALRDSVRRTFDTLVAETSPTEPDYCLFKYRHGRDPWRLVWCWGYQRADAQPAPAVICTNPDCNLLFLRRPGSDGRCPGCADVVERKVAAARRGSRKSLLAALLVLLGLLAILLAGSQHQLEVMPAAWEGPIGSRVAFRVIDRSWFWHQEDVTGQVVPLSHDTRVMQFEAHDCVGIAPGVGRTLASFHFQDRVADVTILAVQADGLTEFRIEPANYKLAFGSTAPVKAIAKDAKGRQHDLTAAVVWEALDPTVAVCQPGLVEGGRPGETVLRATYAPQPDKEPLLAEAIVAVAAEDLASLTILLRPDKVDVGQATHVEAAAQGDSGAHYSLTGSSQLALNVEPASMAKIDSGSIVGLTPGKAEVKATIGKLAATAPLEIVKPASAVAGKLVVKPLEAKLAVGERLRLDVLAPGSDPLEAVSSDPKIVEVVSAKELLGQAEGTTEVRISQGSEQQVVKIRVEPAAVESLRIQPPSLTLQVGSASKLRVIGTLSGGREIDVDPAKLSWSKQPLASNVDFDRQALSLTGLAATDEPQSLQVQYKDLQAEADVKVQGDPKRVLLADDFLAHPPILGRKKPVVDTAPGATDVATVPKVGTDSSTVGTDVPKVVSGDPAAGPQTIAAGPYLGKDLAYRDGQLIVGDVAPDSPLAVAGVAPGSVITGVNGATLAGIPPDKVADYFAEHPVVAGDALQVLTPAGKASQVALGDRFQAVQDVRLVGVEFTDVAVKDFAPTLRVAVREAGEYRISDGQGKALGEWQKLDAGSTAVLSAGKIARTPDDEYELFVERKIGTQTKRFQIPFRLKAEKP